MPTGGRDVVGTQTQNKASNIGFFDGHVEYIEFKPIWKDPPPSGNWQQLAIVNQYAPEWLPKSP
jgi:prepilin-type processing-associated H-X9-DG protein